MLKALRHRGPDDEGLIAFEAANDLHVLLGSCRLAIIDLSEAGRQPMWNEDRSVGVVFNGEIYNFVEMRDRLVQQGHRLNSRTDSEVIAHAYEEMGEDVFAALDGMFAIALWDRNAQRLLLARDRLGKKPLYYYAVSDCVVFGSEIKALLAHPDVPIKTADSMLPYYLIHGYIPDPLTFYEGIRQVPASSYVAIDKMVAQRPVAYWRLRFPDAGREQVLPDADAVEQLHAILTNAVRKRLASDVPLGALLSGGLDSSIVVSSMARLMGTSVRTFTVGFSGDSYFDERPFARLVAQQSNTLHTELVARAGDAALLDGLLWYHDQPYGDSSSLPTFLVSRLTRQHVTVALVGDGGDELFAGYERFRAAILAERIPWIIAQPLGSILRRVPYGRGYSSTRTRLRRFGMGVADPLSRRYLQWVGILPPSLVAQLITVDGVESVVGDVESLLQDVARAHPLHQLLYLNMRTYLPGDLLVKMDRMSMANSLETRSPFLDTALVEFVASLPADQKIRGREQKWLLRRAFRGQLPSTVITRPKHGFGIPLDEWFRGMLKVRVEDELASPQARVAQYLDVSVLRGFIGAHMARRANYGHALWALLNLELWLRSFPRWVREMRAN